MSHKSQCYLRQNVDNKELKPDLCVTLVVSGWMDIDLMDKLHTDIGASTNWSQHFITGG